MLKNNLKDKKVKISAASKNKLAEIILNSPYRTAVMLIDLFNDFC